MNLFSFLCFSDPLDSQGHFYQPAVSNSSFVSACRLGNYPRALQSIFGRTHAQRRLQLREPDLDPAHNLPPIFLENSDRTVTFSDIPDRSPDSPFPPSRQRDACVSDNATSRSNNVTSHHPRLEELELNNQSESSEDGTTLRNPCSGMRARQLPTPPRSQQPRPRVVSEEVGREEPRRGRHREVRIVEKDLSSWGMSDV